MRVKLTEILSPICKVYPIGVKDKKKDEKEWIVLKFSGRVSSAYTNLGAIQTVDVLCYTRGKNILGNDKLVSNVCSRLNEEGIKITNVLSSDFYDEDLNAYMKSVEIKLPMGV